jgi:hypothetical protein
MKSILYTVDKFLITASMALIRSCGGIVKGGADVATHHAL